MLADDIVLGFRFGVYFFVGGIVPNGLDIRFQKVSGLSATVETETVREGGQNIFKHQLPQTVSHGNLVLERGMVVGSPLNIEFNAALSLFKFFPSNVMVILFQDDMVPLSGWLFIEAFPAAWKTSDLDAAENGVVIDTLELAYTRMQMVRL